MDRTFRTIVVFAAATLFLGSAAVLLLSQRRVSGGDHSPPRQNDEPLNVETREKAADQSAGNPGTAQPRKNTRSQAERDKAKYDVGEMRNEAGEWVRKFRGTPEEREEIIRESRDGIELLRTIAGLTVEAYGAMTPDELEKARKEFEDNSRAQLDYLQSGKLQRMLKTPEEEEVIGAAFEEAQIFLERLDDALRAAGY